MKKTVTFREFDKWFHTHRPNNFSNEGLIALWEMFESYEEDTDEQIEFDPVAFCCEYTEYENIHEFWNEYNKEDYPNEAAIMDATHYWAFGHSGSFIILNF